MSAMDKLICEIAGCMPGIIGGLFILASITLICVGVHVWDAREKRHQRFLAEINIRRKVADNHGREAPE